MLCTLGALGCGVAPAADSSDGSLGTVQFAIMTVPSDVKCIKIVAGGTAAFSTNFTVTPSGSTSLTMPGVSPGSNTFSGEAYSIACASVTTTTVANWIADPVVATVTAGGTTNVTLVMRPAGNVGVAVDFQGGGGATGIPLGVWNSVNWDNTIWQ
jgi:hypothetical protein